LLNSRSFFRAGCTPAAADKKERRRIAAASKGKREPLCRLPHLKNSVKCYAPGFPLMKVSKGKAWGIEIRPIFAENLSGM
jgi:hypothetical protein